MPLNVTDDTFQKEVLDSKGLTLIDFWAPWCGPCHMLTPIIDEISEEMGDKVKIGKMNVDENQQISMTYQVMSIPTVMLFKDGEPLQSFIGVQPKQVYMEAIEKASEEKEK